MFDTIIFLSNILFFLSTMLTFKLCIYFDLNKNLFQVIIKVFGIKIITISIDIVGLYYRINNSKKVKPLKLVISKKEAAILKEIKSSVIDKLYFDKVYLISAVNVCNPQITTQVVSCINTICDLIKTIFFLRQKDMVFKYYNTADFINNNNHIALTTVVCFTIFDVLFATVLSFYRRSHYE